MSNTKVHPVGFKLYGDSFTWLVRNILLEPDPAKAQRLLTVAVPDLPAGSLSDVLAGKVRLEGVNTLELVDEDPADPRIVDYLERLHETFSGYFRHGQQFYQPYARLPGRSWFNNSVFDAILWDAYGGDDIRPKLLAYIQDHETDILLPVEDYPPGESWACLCRVVGDPPVFWTPIMSLTEALEQRLAGGRKLPERNVNPLHPKVYMKLMHKITRRDGIPARPLKLDALDEPTSLVEDLVRSAGFSSEAAAGMAVMLGGPVPETLPEPVQSLTAAHKFGWLDPEGDFYPCTYAGHKSLAGLLCRDRKFRIGDKSPDLVLRRKGWCEVGRGEVTGYKVDCERCPTDAQWIILEQYAALHNCRDTLRYTPNTGTIFDHFHKEPPL